MPQDAGVGGWDATGQCSFAKQDVPVLLNASGFHRSAKGLILLVLVVRKGRQHPCYYQVTGESWLCFCLCENRNTLYGQKYGAT